MMTTNNNNVQMPTDIVMRDANEIGKRFRKKERMDEDEFANGVFTSLICQHLNKCF